MFAPSTDDVSGHGKKKGRDDLSTIRCSFFDLITSWTAEIALDMYLICAGATIGW
jgi:hypothetical protein